MKKLFLLLLSSFMISSIYGQEENETIRTGKYDQKTLLRNSGGVTGGFFAPGVRITEVNDQTTLMVGGQLARVLGHQFNIGAVINVMLTDNEAFTYSLGPSPFLPPTRYLEMGYAGLLLEPVFFDRSVIHFSVPTIVGVGVGSTNYYRIWEQGYYDYYGHRSDMFFVLEPGLNAELNVARALRFFAGGSYRFVMDSDLLHNNSDAQLSGFSFNVGLKVGWF